MHNVSFLIFIQNSKYIRLSPRAFTIWMKFPVAFSGQMELHFFSTKETK